MEKPGSHQRFPARLIPADLARRENVAPLAVENGQIEVAAATELSNDLKSRLEFLTGKKVACRVVSKAELARRIESAYPENGGATAKPASKGVRSVRASRDAVGASESRPFGMGSPRGIVDRTIRRAIDRRASDIHFEAYEKAFRVRFRIDGVLHKVGNLPMREKAAIVSRLKVMADLDIAEKRRPQDGRIRFSAGERDIDLRMSTLPTAHGEKVVLRLLDKSDVVLSLSGLGLHVRQEDTLRACLANTHGMILVTGPTGSGKTTTLYAALNELNDSTVNILTAEDPIEYELPGINQVQVRPDIGFGFSQALRSFLRQDPDIIMIGEIRDLETARIAIRSALTGHLVLSTLHTNDAPSAAVRLIDIGIEPYLVAASLRMSIAQRLVRTVCDSCAGEGCPECMERGYSGRSGLFEVMPVSEKLSASVSKREALSKLQRLAASEGMMSLRRAGEHLVKEGRTTREELLRAVTMS